MIKSLKFENFRCFQNFKLDNLGPITLISGRNNSGKTTVLEGIYLILACMRPDVLFHIDSYRGMDFPARQSPSGNVSLILDPLKLWRTLFTNMDMERTLKVTIVTDESKEKSLTLRQDEISSVDVTMRRSNQFPGGDFSPDLSTLEFMYEEERKELFKGIFKINGSALGRNIKGQLPRITLPRGFYFGSTNLVGQQIVAEWIGNIEFKNAKQGLIQSLQGLMPDMTDIFTLPQQTGIDIFCRLSTDQPLPIRVMGDGINKLINYLAAIIANPGSIFLFDEIENGFHYTFYEKLWNLLFKAASDNNCQIIATSHSRECIGAASNVSEEYEQKILSFIRIDAVQGTPCAVSYSKEDLLFAVKNEMEVR